MDIKIVIAVNKKDFWFCRICVASIRYYYPEVEIYLLKDELNGKFSTKEIERKYSVKIYDCGKSVFGWAASKTFFLLQAEKNIRYLILDSDIVFVGPFLERILVRFNEGNFIVSGEEYKEINTQHIRDTYFDIERVLEFDSGYQYPGFYFNTGQLFITGGIIQKEDLVEFFSMEEYPYWKRLDLFPLVDQSVYNYIFPKLNNANRIKLLSERFMIWSEGMEAKTLNLQDVIGKHTQAGLIHWAGANRTPFIEQMTRFDILDFFQNEYYKNDFLKEQKIFYRKYTNLMSSYFQRMKNKIKKLI